MTAIIVENLSKRYGRVAAVDGVSLTVDAGSVHALAGPNGSGKTTLLRCVAGLTVPSEGRVDVGAARVGYAFQRPNVYPDLTVAENLDVFSRLAAADAAWRESLVERLRLDPVRHRTAAALSDGFAKKLDLALALLKEPDLLLLDEPLADIDDATERRLLALLEEYAGPERTVLLTSHNLDAVSPLLDRLTVLVDGRIVRDEWTADLSEAPEHTYAGVLDEWL